MKKELSKQNEIEKELMNNAILHAFCSEDGIRTIQIEKDGNQTTYRAYPQFHGTSTNMENDFMIDHKEPQFLGGIKSYQAPTKMPPILKSIIDCFLLCGKSIDIYYSKKSKQFICNSQLLSLNGTRGYSGIGDNILDALHSCIHSKMLYREYIDIM